MDLSSRIRRLQDIMVRSGIDVAVFSASPSYQYLTGLSPTWRRSRDHISPYEMAVVPKEGEVIGVAGSENVVSSLWFPVKRVCSSQADVVEVFAETAKVVGTAGGSVALDDELKGGVWLAAVQAFEGFEMCSASRLLDSVRMIKDAEEISRLQRAGELTDRAVTQALTHIREGMTMVDLQLEIEFQGRRLGATGVSFDPVAGFIAETGKPTGSIFSYRPDEELRPNTTIFFDVGFVVDGDCSDWGRAVYFGSPPREESHAYLALGDAVEKAVEAIRPGHTRACDLYDLIEAPLDEAGCGDYLRARLPGKSVGHQIGTEVHENPWLEPGYEDVLQPNMVMCLEPKLWKDGSFYLRVEDMILINEDGAEFLTNFDRREFALP